MRRAHKSRALSFVYPSISFPAGGWALGLLGGYVALGDNKRTASCSVMVPVPSAACPLPPACGSSHAERSTVKSYAVERSRSHRPGAASAHLNPHREAEESRAHCTGSPRSGEISTQVRR